MAEHSSGECHMQAPYTECLYAECRYTECRGAVSTTRWQKQNMVYIFYVEKCQ